MSANLEKQLERLEREYTAIKDATDDAIKMYDASLDGSPEKREATKRLDALSGKRAANERAMDDVLTKMGVI